MTNEIIEFNENGLQAISPYNVITKTGIEYTIDNVNYRQLKNGAIFDISLHKIVGMDANGYMISKENASELSLKRWRMARNAAQYGIKNVNGSTSSLETWSLIAKNQAQIALSDSKFSTLAARFIGDITGYIPTKNDINAINDAKNSATNDGITVSISPEIAKKMLQLLRDVKNK